MLYVHQKPSHAISSKDVIEHLKTSESSGLEANEAKARIKKVGLNHLESGKKITPVEIFLRQFKSFIIAILAFAAAVSFYLGETVEGYVISSIIIIVSIIGFLQEYKAENILESIKKLTTTHTRVLRGKKLEEVSSEELVPGDIIFLEAGDKVPADARIIKSSSLEADESALTGESKPVKKEDSILADDTLLAERKNMIFMGSYISDGNVFAVITHTGVNTEMGKIIKEIPTESEVTPLQKSMDDFGKKLSFFVIAIGIIVIIFELLKGAEIYNVLLISIAIVVSGIPESLPIIIAIGLAHSVHKMAGKNALVRKMDAVEALGCVTVICSDKTGTITKNEMTVTKIYADEMSLDVTGNGYKPEGDFIYDGKKIDLKENETFQKLFTSGLLCNNAQLIYENNLWLVLGDTTEGSLITLGRKAGIYQTMTDLRYFKVSELPFDSERKCMSVIYSTVTRTDMFSKGSPGVILNKCRFIEKNGKITELTEDDKEKIKNIYGRYSSESLRVLAFAYKASEKKKEIKAEDESDLIFLGLAGIKDPPRDGIKESIAICKSAGIKTVMITGDNIITATSIAKDIGLINKDDLVIKCSEIDKMSEQEFMAIAEKIAVYARATPEHKLKIIDALEKKGHIVAMTGDGVNDAIALKKAHIGISMGLKGTDVAKEASDISLLDDNFNTIVSAIKEGRTTYDNMKKAMQFVLSVTTAEMGSIIVALFLSLPLPLTAIMVLFINLVTDDLPAMGISLDSAEKNVMHRKPRKSEEPMVDKSAIKSMLYAGISMTFATFGIFAIYHIYMGEDIIKSQTMAFATLMSMEILYAYGIRAKDGLKNIKDIFTNTYLNATVAAAIVSAVLVIMHPSLQVIFNTSSITFFEALAVIITSIAVVLMIVYSNNKKRQNTA